MQLHLFPSRNSSGKMTLSSPVEFDWQGAAKERKWFSKSDLRKTIFFLCSHWTFVASGVTGKTNLSTALFLNKSIIKISKHSWYHSSKQTENSIHLLMHSPWRDCVSLCLKDLRALIIFVCRNTVLHMKETQRKKPLF